MDRMVRCYPFPSSARFLRVVGPGMAAPPVLARSKMETEVGEVASQLRSSVRYIVVALSALLALFIVSQIAQVVGLANSLHPWLGVAVGLLLVGGLVWLLAVPTVAYFRLSPALEPPKEVSGAQHDEFVATYLAACRENPRLEGQRLEGEADLDAALKLLTKEAERVVNRTASRVFIRAAISQYVQPVLAGMVGQSAAAVPGVAGVATQFSNAVFQGSVNAFLTLRLGMVAIAYSNATSTAKRGAMWQSAVLRAGSLLVRTVIAGTAELSKAFAAETDKVIGNTARDAGQKVADGAVWLGTGAAGLGRPLGQPPSVPRRR